MAGIHEKGFGMHVWDSQSRRALANPENRYTHVWCQGCGRIISHLLCFAQLAVGDGEEHGVPSYWEGCDGNEDNSTAISGTDGGCPDALLRLRHPVRVRNYDVSGMGPGNDAVLTDNPDFDNYDDDECDGGHGDCSRNDTPRRVQSMKLVHFRQKLVVHFNIAIHKNEL